MNIVQAEAIIKAFGSCSTVYECTTPKEMIEDYETNGGTLQEYVALLYSCEGVHLERASDGASYRSDEYHQEVIDEHKELRAGQRDRLTAIGYKVGS